MPVEDETMKNPARILTGLVAALWMFMGMDVMGQGTLAPTNAPSESMKSLQEIWDRIGDMEAKQSAQQADIDQVQEQTATIEQQNSMLLGGQTNIQTQQSAIQGIMDTNQAATESTLAAQQGVLQQENTQVLAAIGLGTIQTVDSAGDVGLYTSLAFTPGGHPAISYYDATRTALKYAVYNGASWVLSTVYNSGDTGRGTSLAFTPGGQPAISYTREMGHPTGGRLYYSVYNGTSWSQRIVDGSFNVDDFRTSLAFSPAGQPAIAYSDDTNRDLKYAVYNGASWIRSTVDNITSIKPGASLAFSPGGLPAISYHASNLKYAVYDGTNWVLSTVDSTAGVGKYTSLAFNPGGEPAISYYDGNNQDLKYAVYNGATWNLSTVDTNASVGSSSSLASTPSGQPAISYYDLTNGDLKYAVYDGASWDLSTIDSAERVGAYTSLAFSPKGQPAISYWDYTNENLKFALVPSGLHAAQQATVEAGQATTEAAVLAGQATSQATIEAAIAAQPSDPRTPITSLPTTISQPGSYYLVDNLASTGHGITIQASGVTLDLGGFSMTGNGDTQYYGIYVAGTSTNNPVDKLLVKGGSISNFGNGLRAKFTENSRFEQLVVSGSTSHGFLLTGNTGLCNGNTVVDCSVSGSTGVGFYLDGRGGQCNGNRLVDCTTRNNGGTGLYLTGECGQCDGNTIRGNAASKNSGRGIYISYANGNRVEANHVWGTTGASSYGIQTGSTTTGNFILKNTSVGQANNFALDIDDTYGPIVTSSGALSGTDPWANFSR
jgi:parallel beta-helix repeat protein